MNIFEYASRNKLQFPSNRGALTTEQLWDLPLSSKSGFDLDTVAKTLNRELKEMAEESFVATASNPKKARTEQSLEIVKYIIQDRLASNAAANAASARRQALDQLLAAREAKQEEGIKNLTLEEIDARIAALQG